jgi:hypothetical protein
MALARPWWRGRRGTAVRQIEHDGGHAWQGGSGEGSPEQLVGRIEDERQCSSKGGHSRWSVAVVAARGQGGGGGGLRGQPPIGGRTSAGGAHCDAGVAAASNHTHATYRRRCGWTKCHWGRRER